MPNLNKQSQRKIKGQQAIEYIILFATVMVILLFLLSPAGPVASQVRKAVDRPFCWMEQLFTGTCKALCGNGTCDVGGSEDCWSCPDDCGFCVSTGGGTFCGDGSCTGGENCTTTGLDGCWADCGICGGSVIGTGIVCDDGVCDGRGETCATCPADCPCSPGNGNSCSFVDILVPGSCGAIIRFGPTASGASDLKNCPVTCGFGTVSVDCLNGVFSAVNGQCN